MYIGQVGVKIRIAVYQMGTVYFLQSLVNLRYYIGSTGDMNRRMEEHNLGTSKYTRLTKPFRLVFTQEYPTIKEARRIEYKLKKQKSRVLVERIIKEGKILMGT